MSQTNTGRNAKGRFVKGNKAAAKHYCHTFLVTNRLPQIRGVRRIQKYLDRVRKELEACVSEMTVQKQILIDQVMKAQGFCMLFELYAKRMGLFDPEAGKRGRLDFMPGFRTYLSLVNCTRGALAMLGIDGETREPILTPLEIVKTEKGVNDENQND